MKKLFFILVALSTIIFVENNNSEIARYVSAGNVNILVKDGNLKLTFEVELGSR